MAYEIYRLDQINETYIEQAISVLVVSFYDEFKFLNKDFNELVDAMKNTFNLKQVYVAVEAGQVIGMVAYSTAHSFSQFISLREAVQAFGFWKGYFCSKAMNRKPLQLDVHQCYVEDVATHPDHRGRGVATALINYLIHDMKYEEYVLEVVDTNTNAIRIYTKLGFKKYHAKKENILFRKALGYNERQYMKRRD